MFPNSDLIIEPVEELRKVLGTITLFAELGSTEKDSCDPAAVLGFIELIEDRLTAIRGDLEAAMEIIDNRTALNTTTVVA